MLKPLRVMLADDHLLFRQGLKSLLLLQPDIEVVAEVETAAELLPAVSGSASDILLLDLQMDQWSMDEIPKLARLTSVIIVTASESPDNGVRAISLGARAVVQKRFAIETLMTAIRAVAEGLVWMPPAVQAHFAMEASSPKKLTPRETEIVRHVANGMRNAQVAQNLSISESTVKTHLNKVFQKLNLRDRVELIRYALKTGLTRHPDQDR